MTQIWRPLGMLSLCAGCYSPNQAVVTAADGDSATLGTGGESPVTDSSGSDPSVDDDTSQGDEATDSSATQGTTTSDVPECGDGIINGLEVCDDGVNNGAYGGCVAGCSAFGPHCGDDAVQGSEDCDDADDQNGDGCNIDCTISGEIVWTRTLDVSGGATAVAVGDDDMALVATYSSEFHLYDSAGNPGWDVGYQVPSATGTYGGGVAYDATSGWLVGGRATVLGQATNSWWQRFDEAGVEGDGGSYDSPSHEDDYFGALAFDASGNFYLAGYSDSDLQTCCNSDSWLRKFDAAGNSLWARPFDGGSDDSAHAAAVGPDGSVTVVGHSIASGVSDIWLRKYDAEGEEQWTRIGEHGATQAFGAAVAVGADGSIAVAGGELGDIVVRLYSPGGVEIWDSYHDGAGADLGYLEDTGLSVAIDSAGCVIAAGAEFSVGNDIQAWLRKFAPDGDVLWSVTPEADATTSQSANGVAVDSNDYVIVVGSTNPGTGWVVKYTP